MGLTQNLVPARPVISEFTDNTQKSLRMGRVEFTAVEADFQPVPAREPAANWSVARASRPTRPTATSSPARHRHRDRPGRGATIYYTTDGSHPYAGNAAAQYIRRSGSR